MRKIAIITLFPQALKTYLQVGMLAKASLNQIVQYKLIDLRDYGLGVRRQVDDTPYGGGDGMILRIEPLVAAIEDLQNQFQEKADVVLLTPRGKLFSQEKACQLAESNKNLILLGGRYTGYDERLVNWADHQVSIGNYVLTGSDLPALVVVDAVVRLFDGVLGGDSRQLESFSSAQIKKGHPQYTKPEVFRDLKVPQVLTSGNHQAIDAWRKERISKPK